MSKLVNELPFGATLAEKMIPGVLVSWSEWMITDNDLIEVIYYGTIVNKSIKIPNTNVLFMIAAPISVEYETVIVVGVFFLAIL